MNVDRRTGRGTDQHQLDRQRDRHQRRFPARPHAGSTEPVSLGAASDLIDGGIDSNASADVYRVDPKGLFNPDDNDDDRSTAWSPLTLPYWRRR